MISKNMSKLKEKDYIRLFGVSKEVFEKMLKVLDNKKISLRSKLSTTEKLIITILYSREYRTLENLAFEYGVSQSTIYKYIKDTEKILLEENFLLPSKKKLKKILNKKIGGKKMNNEITVKHNEQGENVEFVYKNKEAINFFRFFSNDEVEIVDLENEDKKYTIRHYEDLKKIKGMTYDDNENLSNYIKEKITQKDKERILDIIRPLEIEEINEEVPELNFFDYTENYLLGTSSISKNFLEDKEQGIWANFGIRKLKIEISNLERYKHLKIKNSLRFFQKDNDSLDEEIEAISKNLYFEEGKLILDIELNSNSFIKEFKEKEQYAKFKGNLELKLEENEGSLTICFPIQIIFHNTDLAMEKNKGIIKNTDRVSIDFGTSSTCVAISNSGRIEFMTLSSENEIEEGYNKYENPTNIMIYRWGDLYKQWKNENKNLPLFYRGNKEDNDEGKKINYDSGYTVKELIKDANKKELNSILTQIKLIPYELEKETTLTLVSLLKEDNNEKDVIKLVNDFELQNDESFDPIAFYSYLLGRTINNPNNSKIYTKFLVTYPVKFNEQLRKKLKKSIEYGLKRSLPISLQNAVDEKGRPIFSVNMKYSEPVAYVGAICGNYLKLDKNPREYFAIYDFGGGTLDFSFGIFKESEDEDDDAIIEILGVDGNEEIGGERLINRMSYWIYQDETNIESFKENKIPFPKLREEKITDGMQENLLNNSVVAKLNLIIVNEAISRLLFEGKEDEVADTLSLSLYTITGNETVEVNITTNKDVILDKLRNVLQENVNHFFNALRSSFENNIDNIKENDKSINSFEDILKKVNIFKSGNAVKNKILSDLIEQKFPENKIYLVDETNPYSEKIEEKKYAITPKTAVAYGQLNIETFTLDDSNIKNKVFAWNVYKFLPKNGELRVIISRQDKENDWKFFSKIKNEKAVIYFSSDLREEKNDVFEMPLEFDEEENGKFLYIRAFRDDELEYIVKENKEEDILETSEIKRVVLKNNN